MYIYIGKNQNDRLCLSHSFTVSCQAHSTKTSNERTHPSFTSKQQSRSVLAAAFAWHV